MKISVVIPTCNRRARLLSLLGDLSRSIHPLWEVLDRRFQRREAALPTSWSLPESARSGTSSAEKSVCAQRNRGIREAEGDWIFLCDDDVEVPPDYLSKLAAHLETRSSGGCGLRFFLEGQGAGAGRARQPVTSARSLLWRYLFQLGVWGEIRTRGPAVDWIVERYRRRGNHISRAGWPVITDFSAPFLPNARFYAGRVASQARVVARTRPTTSGSTRTGSGTTTAWQSDFRPKGSTSSPSASVRHHREDANRLPQAVAYGRRILALHYFVKTRTRAGGRQRRRSSLVAGGANRVSRPQAGPADAAGRGTRPCR